MLAATGNIVPAVVVSAAVIIGAVSDLRGFRLPNRLTLPLVLSGLLWHLACGAADGLTRSACGLLIASLPLLPAWAAGGMGAGDVKLMSGIGAWLGALFALQVLILAGLAGWVFFRLRRLSQPELAQLTQPALPVEQALLCSHQRRQLLPFGVMIAAGTLIQLLLFSIRSAFPDT
jgi:Flp pilus assembly protein protease CpaA